MSDSPTAGDQLCWDQWLSIHESWLRKVILARTREPQAVDDVFQQLAMAVVEQHHSLREPEKLTAWLHRMAVLQSLRHRRAHGRRRRATEGLANRVTSIDGESSDGVLRFVLDRERNERTREALLKLPGRDAELLLLKYDLRWSYRRIAEHFGIPEKTVDSRLVRARSRLRAEVLKNNIESGDL
ncbi:MAG: sigma-70 family RNA polymerase sigma factor [Pirellulaceae bacterium]